MVNTTVKIATPVKPQVTTNPLDYVSPAELCQQQTRAMAADAFTALTAFGL